MSAERRKRLDAIGLVWDARESAWEKGFIALTAFKAREGHCRVPQRYGEGTVKLGHWVSNQRVNKDNISAERKKRLDDIGFAWNPFASEWEKGFAALTTFKAREGHCRAPDKHVEGTFKLGTWVRNQRQSRDTMSAERRKRLDAIGFVWGPFESAWEEGFAALKQFKAREGHCRAPDKHVEGALKLGRWVGRQRQSRDTMPAERRRRLDEMSFVWRVK